MEDWMLARSQSSCAKSHHWSKDAMLKDIAAAHAMGDHRLYLRFEDGVEGVVDLAPLLKFEGVFAPLEDPAYFAQVSVDRELGSVVWPNGADLDPDVLYARITGTPVLHEQDVHLPR
jgi:hypothetical protein